MNEQVQVGRYQFVTPVVMIHPHLAEARAYQKGGKVMGEPKYSASFLFAPESPELAEIISKCVLAARQKWSISYRHDKKTGSLRATKQGPDGKPVWDQSVPGVHLPIANGDAAADNRLAARKKVSKPEDERGKVTRGHTILKTASSYQPKLGMLANGGIVELEDDAIKANAGKFFFGAEALAIINCKGTESPQGRFVTAYLQEVLVTGKGKRIKGGASMADSFKSYVGKPTNEDPIGDDPVEDDEIPY